MQKKSISPSPSHILYDGLTCNVKSASLLSCVADFFKRIGAHKNSLGRT